MMPLSDKHIRVTWLNWPAHLGFWVLGKSLDAIGWVIDREGTARR